MEQNSLTQSHEYHMVKDLEQGLNNSAFSYNLFTQSIPSMHPSIQQNFYRMIRGAILFMATPGNVPIDARNKASYEMCKRVASILEDCPLPYI